MNKLLCAPALAILSPPASAQRTLKVICAVPAGFIDDDDAKCGASAESRRRLGARGAKDVDPLPK